jgi:hypothetical protein
VALASVLICGLALTQPYKLTEGIWTLNLPGDCYLDYYVSIQAVGLSGHGLHATLAVTGQAALARPNGLAGVDDVGVCEEIRPSVFPIVEQRIDMTPLS